MKTSILFGSLMLSLGGIAQTGYHALKLLQTYTPINIGDTVEYSFLKNALQPAVSPGSQPDLRGKIILLEWWTPECAPCIAGMPKLDSLQKQFKDKASIFALRSTTKINDSVADKAKKFWAKNKYTRSTTLHWMLDTILYKKFPHDGAPFVVWLDSNLVVRAFSAGERVNAIELESFRHGNTINWENPNKIQFDCSIPFRVHPFLKDIILTQSHHSVATTYVPRINPTAGLDSTQDSIRYYAVNVPIVKLYRYALGFIRAKDNPIGVKYDSSIFEIDYKRTKGTYNEYWKKKNLYSYEINIPKSLPNEERYQYIIEDLNKLFNLHSTIIQEPINCLILEENYQKASPKKTSKNLQKINLEEMEIFKSAEDLTSRLRKGLYTVPVFSSTAIKRTIPIMIPRTYLNPISLDNISAINNYLIEAGYKLSKSTRTYPVLHIK